MLEYGIRVSKEREALHRRAGGRLFFAREGCRGGQKGGQTDGSARSKADPFLFSIFSGVTPVGASLLHLVSSIGCSAIVIEADPRAAGVISRVTGVLAKHGIVVRQALADDPDMVKEANLTLVVEGPVGGSVIGELEGLEMVRGITVRK